MPLSSIIPAEVFAFLLVFARIGTIFVVIPLFSESYIPQWVRLSIALVMTVLLTPLVAPLLPAEPRSVVATIVLLAGELTTGLFIGLIIRVLVATLSTAGIMLSFISGLASALTFNPLLQSQGILHSALLTLSGIMFILALDLHHMFFYAIADSYALMPVVPDSGAMAEVMARYVANGFAMALKLITPVLLVILLFYAILGFASRLMPQLHIFFIGLPVQIGLSFFALAIIFTEMMFTYLEYLIDALNPFLLGG